MKGFNTEEYWKGGVRKVRVVTLKKRRGSKVVHFDTKIVGAKTEQGAITTARYHSFMKGINDVSCRLATPTDLGCVPDNSNNAKRVA